MSQRCGTRYFLAEGGHFPSGWIDLLSGQACSHRVVGWGIAPLCTTCCPLWPLTTPAQKPQGSRSSNTNSGAVQSRGGGWCERWFTVYAKSVGRRKHKPEEREWKQHSDWQKRSFRLLWVLRGERRRRRRRTGLDLLALETAVLPTAYHSPGKGPVVVDLTLF